MTVSAIEKRAEPSSGSQLGFGLQYLWHASSGTVDMAMPSPAALPVTMTCAPQNVTVDLRRSSSFCTEATIWNVKKCFGFVTGSEAVITAVSSVVLH